MWILGQQKASGIDSDTESEHETHGVGEHAFASIEGWTEDKIFSQKSDDFTGVAGLTTEGNNPQRASEKTVNFWPAKRKITGHRC